MAKGATQETERRAKNIGDQSTQQTQSNVMGGPGGAFGPSGLSGDYKAAQDFAGQSRDAAFTGIQKIQDTGGYDPNQLNMLRGTGTEAQGFYRGMMNTGGYNPKDISNYLNQATSGLSNTYTALANQDARRRAAQSGLGGDSTALMARQLAQEQARTTTGALADIHRAVIENQFGGAKGLTDTTTALGGLESDVARGRREGSQLMSHLYDTDTGRITEAGNMILKMYGIDTQNQGEALQALTEMAKRPGMLDNILKIAETAGGIATGGMSSYAKLLSAQGKGGGS